MFFVGRSDALMQTRGITLVHTSGTCDPHNTILTPDELCGISIEMRSTKRYGVLKSSK